MPASRVIGLDIGTSAVRAAEVEFPSASPARPGTPTLTRLAQAALPPGAVRDGEVNQPEVVTHALRQLWAAAGFSTKSVVLGVGNQRVLVRDIQVPAMSMAQVRASLPFQVQDLLPVSASDALLDFHPISESDGPAGRVLDGMLVAAQRDTVLPNVLAAEHAGLVPTMVDLNAFALLRALSRGDLAQRIVAFVDIGARVTNVVVADRGTPRLVRMIPTGGQTVTDAISGALQVPPPEAERLKREIGVGFAVNPGQEAAADAIATTVRGLVEAIRNTLVFYASNHPGAPVEAAVLTGGGAHLPGLGQYLSSSTRLPAVLGNPLTGFRFGKGVNRAELDGAESLIAVAVGLAYGVAA